MILHRHTEPGREKRLGSVCGDEYGGCFHSLYKNRETVKGEKTVQQIFN